MATYRSAMGKTVDMSAIVAKNEKVRAVGNVKNLNARGDTIDALGRVIQPATDKVNNAYAKTVGNRSANAGLSCMATPMSSTVDWSEITLFVKSVPTSVRNAASVKP